MDTSNYFSLFLALINFIFECYSSSSAEFYDPNNVIHVENFYPPEGYQPVKGYEPPNYRPYKRILEALSNKQILSNLNRQSSVKHQQQQAGIHNKFIDRQTNIDIYGKPYYNAMGVKHNTPAPPLEHRINNPINPNPGINQFHNQVPFFNNHGVKMSFDTQNLNNMGPQSTSHNPFYVANNHYLNVQKESARPVNPIYSLNTQRPVEIPHPPYVPPPPPPQFLPPSQPFNVNKNVLPPHMSENFNYFNQQPKAPVVNKPQNTNFEFVQEVPPGFHAQKPFFIANQSMNNCNVVDPAGLTIWKNFVTSSTLLPTSPFKKPSMEPNWRRTPPQKGHWTNHATWPTTRSPFVENFWTEPAVRPTTRQPFVENYWNTVTPVTSIPQYYYQRTTETTYWTPLPVVYQTTTTTPMPTTTSTYTAPSVPSSTSYLGATVDYKQLFMNNKLNMSNNNNNYAGGVSDAEDIELVIDNNCMKCLCFIESWCSDVGCVWDQGSLSCGWYQLKYEYWLDCGAPGGGWKECANNKKCAEGCVRAYMKRYRRFCSAGQTCPDLARIHNGGLYGCGTNTTEYYGWLIGRCLRREAPYETIDLIYKNMLDTNKISP